MKTKLVSLRAVLATALFFAASPAGAGTIAGLGSPLDAIPGGTVIDFASTPLGGYPVLTVAGVTITASHVDNGTELPVSFGVGDNGGLNNTTGRALTSDPGSLILPQIYRFDFSSPVDAFAFNFGGFDARWVVAGYSGTDALIDALPLSYPIFDSNLGEYYGISGGGIAYAILTQQSFGDNDLVWVDNFTYSGTLAGGPSVVPLPAALPLFLSGLIGLGFLGRKRRQRDL